MSIGEQTGAGDPSVRPAPGGWARREAPLLALLLVALLLRCLFLDRSLWLDEGLSLEQAVALDSKDGQRPLYFLFLRLWMHTGGSEIWLRLPSVLFGVAGVGVLVAVARRLVGPGPALLAGAFMALSTALIWHAQEVRMYSLSPLLVLLAALTLLRWLERGTRGRLAAHALCVYLALLCHPLAAPGLGLMGAMALLALRGRPGAGPGPAPLLVAYALVILAWAPFLFLGVSSADEFGWVQRPHLTALVGIHDWAFIKYSRRASVRALLDLLLVGCVFASFWARGGAGDRRAALPAATFFYGAVGALFVASLVFRPMWVPRYFTCYAPALFLLVAIGVARLHARSRALAVALASGVMVLQLVSLRILARPEEDWRAAARHVEDHAAAADHVFVMGAGSGPVGIWSYYFKRPSIYVHEPSELPASTEAGPAARTWIVARVEGHEDRPARIIDRLGAGAAVRTQEFIGVTVLEADAKPVSAHP